MQQRPRFPPEHAPVADMTPSDNRPEPAPSRGRSAGAYTAYHVASLLVVVILPSQLWFGEAVWRLPVGDVWYCFAAGIAYVVGALAMRIVEGPLRVRFGASAAAIVVALAGALVFPLVRPDLDVSRGVLLVGGAYAAFAALAYELARSRVRLAQRVWAAPALAAVAVVAWGVATAPGPDPDAGFIRTAYHPAHLAIHDSVVATEDFHPGGAIRLVGRQVVAVTGGGVFYALSRSEEGGVVGRRLDLESPLNLIDFDEAVPEQVSRQGFRVMDFVTRPVGNGWEIFMSHHYWHGDRSCLVVRVSRATVDASLVAAHDPRGAWKPVFETSPCMPIEGPSRRPPLAAIASGGRLAWRDDGHLLLTTGDLEKPELAQLDTTDFGRTLLIDVRTGRSEEFTRGHRNAQGLLVESDAIWSTEHGPMGGDELNALTTGGNYGWPITSLGTDYGYYAWESPPGIPMPDSTVGPVFTWTPSIGVSNLIRVRGDGFPRWSGDLLVASLRGRALFRLRIADGRVVNTEAIPIGRRVRDLVEDPDGTIWLWSEHVLATLDPGGAHERGGELFAVCMQCHLVEVESGGLGPTLWNIVDRRVADRDDFEYSEALRRLGGRWSEERLDAFLAAPDRFAPGTTMIFPGIDDPADRAALIGHLRKLER